MLRKIIYAIALVMIVAVANSQPPAGVWHGIMREIHYQPQDNKDVTSFETHNGKMRFNRALYGTNTAFRVETGDLPEFALYLPGMGGNFKLGLVAGNNSKWLIDAMHITASYRPGSMRYHVQDSMLGDASLWINVYPLADKEGMIVAAEFVGVKKDIQLFWAFGGATGKKFSRDGDIGADPESSFYLQPGYCKDNKYIINDNHFVLSFGAEKARKQLAGIVPPASNIKLLDAAKQEAPLSFFRSAASATPAIGGLIPVKDTTLYFLITPGDEKGLPLYDLLPALLKSAEAARLALAERIKIHSDDPYINSLGGALSIAADAIWEDPSYLHGAVAWRMRLPAWRGAYAADALGLHDRAKKHFSSYALSQVTTPETAPVVMDTALHLARHLEKIGTGMFTSGYICRNPNGDIRPHHYDMNLVFIDQLLNHFNWTGDTAYVKEMWPVIERHLAWEKRNFDADDDGLFDAYCCIWASDALQYSGGGVTHSSAYNYRAFKAAAELAAIIGRDGSAYKKEAEKIRHAINKELWMPQQGWYAEYKDLLGKKLVHDIPGLWTIYHALDAKLPDAFQAYQSTRYVDTEIPHIPVQAKGLPDSNLYLLSTTNWQPYSWSLNNVALAENLHMALAYWQANRPEEAFRLWKSALVESMYLGASPGGFQQLSFYDAVRGQLYRDFADPIGIAARTLVEGLFGIQPDALHDTLLIKPGFPGHWKNAYIETPDISFGFNRYGNSDVYRIRQLFSKEIKTKLVLRATHTNIQSVRVNKQPVSWRIVENAVGSPQLEIIALKGITYYDLIEIKWKGDKPSTVKCDSVYAAGDSIQLYSGAATIVSVYDPQQVLSRSTINRHQLSAFIKNVAGNKNVFVQLKQGAFTWWQPLCFKVTDPLEMTTAGNTVFIRNRSKDSTGQLWINDFGLDIIVSKINSPNSWTIQPATLRPGTNFLYVKTKNHVAKGEIRNWQINASPRTVFDKIDLSAFFNEKVTNIFKQNYLSPRPTSPTLQLPTQGIGNWCYPLTTTDINDSGLRKQAGIDNEIKLPQGIPFATPGDTNRNNIVFTAQWDNFPDSIIIPLSGKAKHAYMLMAGTTNPMQSRMVNGEVRILYRDGSADTLPLKNPVNWWPIEQDYMNDGYAFTTDGYMPLRYYLKKGIAATSWDDYITIKGFSNRGIDGGAATVLDLPVSEQKELKSVIIHTLANDVVIGLMSLTLVRSGPLGVSHPEWATP